MESFQILIELFDIELFLEFRHIKPHPFEGFVIIDLGVEVEVIKDSLFQFSNLIAMSVMFAKFISEHKVWLYMSINKISNWTL
jgi:hypothetical protein